MHSKLVLKYSLLTTGALVVGIVMIFALSSAGKSALRRGTARHGSARQGSGIVSLAPSITETLFALGLGAKVTGVTQYCDFPPEAARCEKIGGFYDPNYEAILLLRPELVVSLVEAGETNRNLTGAGLRVLEVNHQTIDGILESLGAIGKVCGAQQRAGELLAAMNARIERVKRKSAGRRCWRVIVSIGNNDGSSSRKEVRIAGKDDFYDAMLAAAGCTNVYQGGAVRYPTVTTEGMISLDPEVIIDIVDDVSRFPGGCDEILAEWLKLQHVDAVKNGRVHVLAGNHLMRPGPRVAQTLEDIAKALHPEADWEN